MAVVDRAEVTWQLWRKRTHDDDMDGSPCQFRKLWTGEDPAVSAGLRTRCQLASSVAPRGSYGPRWEKQSAHTKHTHAHLLPTALPLVPGVGTPPTSIHL